MRMPTTQRPLEPVERYLLSLWLIAIWTGAGVMLLSLFPVAAPAFPVLCVVVPLVSHIAAKRRLPHYRPSALTLALALAGIYLLINATWSLSPSVAYRSALFFFLIVGVLHAVPNLLNEMNEAPLRAVAVGFIAGLMLIGAFFCIEIWTDQWTHRLVMSWVPSIRPKSREMLVDADKVVFLVPSVANRSITVLTVLFWPAVLIIEQLRAAGRERLYLLAGLVPILAAVLRSEHATSKMALIGSAAIFGIFHLWPLLGRRLAIVGYAAAILLVVPAALLAYGNGLYVNTWLPRSAQHRVVIWGYTAMETAKAPLLGAGLASARATDTGEAPHAPGTDFSLSTSIHSHNAYLQIWYETGAVGALILLGWGLMLLNSLSAEPADLQPALFAGFAACALMAASSFSIWAPWFMATLAGTAIFMSLGIALARQRTA
jgi:O-antigen ligase